MERVFVKNCMMICLIAASQSIYASTLTNYNDLAAALKKGDDVVAIINFDYCATKNPVPITKGASTRANFNIFSQYKVRTDLGERFAIATSNTILTEHRDLGLVYAYGRLRVFEDNTAEFHTGYYDAKTHESKVTMNYQCSVGTTSDAGVVLIDKNH